MTLRNRTGLIIHHNPCPLSVLLCRYLPSFSVIFRCFFCLKPSFKTLVQQQRKPIDLARFVCWCDFYDEFNANCETLAPISIRPCNVILSEDQTRTGKVKCIRNEPFHWKRVTRNTKKKTVCEKQCSRDGIV